MGTSGTLNSAKVLPTNRQLQTHWNPIPTWLRGLWLRGGRGRAGCVLGGALWEEAPPRRELHAQLLCHLHVVPRVDIVKDAASCQLHLERERNGERGVMGCSAFRAVAQWCRFGGWKETRSGPSSNSDSKSPSSATSGFLGGKWYFFPTCIYLAIV